MNEDKLSDTVREYKDFINRHPKLRAEIRRSGESWQEHYEKWALLGEDDSHWNQYNQPEDKKTEFIEQLIHLSKNIDINKVQNQIEQLNTTIGIVQEMLNGFTKKDKSNENHNEHTRLFNMFRD